MNEMRKLMESVSMYEVIQEVAEVHGVEYAAAYLYINSHRFGRTKPELAKVLSGALGIGRNEATQMIDAIDAYEDIREAEEFKA
jgi:hypothetical protein